MLHLLKGENIRQYTNKRKGESKLGEQDIFPRGGTLEKSLEMFEGKYVILGIEEDIGPIANLGNEGANMAWDAFLSYFLNIQYNVATQNIKPLILGSIRNKEWQKDNLENNRKTVKNIDSEVYEVITTILVFDKIPIIIGGGHNNCYPIIKAVSTHNKKAINCINFDPHADIRSLEGRHSGNGFSYALEEKYLENYHVIGLQEIYNSEHIIQQFKENRNLNYYTFNQFVLNGLPMEFLPTFISSSTSPLGIEIDMDSITNMPSSAKSPIGFSAPEIVRILFDIFTLNSNFAYIHLPEAAPQTAKEKLTVGKTLTYLVSSILQYAS